MLTFHFKMKAKDKIKFKIGSLVRVSSGRIYSSTNKDNSTGRITKLDSLEPFTVEVDTKSKGGPSWENIKKLKLVK